MDDDWEVLDGGIPTFWKMMEFVSWDDDIANWMEKKDSCSKAPTRSLIFIQTYLQGGPPQL